MIKRLEDVGVIERALTAVYRLEDALENAAKVEPSNAVVPQDDDGSELVAELRRNYLSLRDALAEFQLDAEEFKEAWGEW